MGTAELRRGYLEQIAGCIGTYIHEGHPVRLRTWHGRDERANAVAFLITDWPAFVAIMEPLEHARADTSPPAP